MFHYQRVSRRWCAPMGRFLELGFEPPQRLLIDRWYFSNQTSLKIHNCLNCSQLKREIIDLGITLNYSWGFKHWALCQLVQYSWG